MHISSHLTFLLRELYAPITFRFSYGIHTPYGAHISEWVAGASIPLLELRALHDRVEPVHVHSCWPIASGPFLPRKIDVGIPAKI